MINPEGQATISAKYAQLAAHLNEKTLRLWAATEALALGRGGISLVARATGLSRTTIHTAIQELVRPADPAAAARVRRQGGGRAPLTRHDPQSEAGLARPCAILPSNQTASTAGNAASDSSHRATTARCSSGAGGTTTN